MQRKLSFLAVAAATLVLTGAASAQVIGKRDQQTGQNAQSGGGSVTEGLGSNPVSLSGGFTGDPRTYSFVAGGAENTAEHFGEYGCSGMAADDPSLTLDYTAASQYDFDLHISVNANSDTTLVVGTPDARVLCDDDSGEGLNPYVHIDNPQTGRYLVWVAAYGSDASSRVSGTLYVSELGSLETLRSAGMLSGGSSSSSSAQTLTGGGAHTSDSEVELSSGFSPDPYRVAVSAGGEIDVHTAFDHCRGWIPDTSNVLFQYTASDYLPLIFSVVSDVDTTLVVQGPDDQFLCDDDGGEIPLSPAIRIDSPQTGTYDVWIGTYSESAVGTPATLFISELESQ